MTNCKDLFVDVFIKYFAMFLFVYSLALII